MMLENLSFLKIYLAWKWWLAVRKSQDLGIIVVTAAWVKLAQPGLINVLNSLVPNKTLVAVLAKSACTFLTNLMCIHQ